jgi:hypothetical protein
VAARLAAQDRDRSRMVERPLVGSLAAQRVVDVDDGEEARAERDLLALESARVAAAAPVLVVGVGDLARDAQVLRLLQDLEADLRVGPHHRPLLRAELAALEQDRVGDADLPDVVQQRAAVDVEQVALRHAGDDREVERPERDAVGVARGLLLPRVEGADQRAQRLLAALVEALQRLLEVARALAEARRVVLERLLARDVEAVAFERAPERLDQRRPLLGEQHVVGARAPERADPRRRDDRADHDDRQAGGEQPLLAHLQRRPARVVVDREQDDVGRDESGLGDEAGGVELRAPAGDRVGPAGEPDPRPSVFTASRTAQGRDSSLRRPWTRFAFVDRGVPP